MSRTLAAVVAHPDDDAFGVAGTVALHADDPELRFVLIHATSGEAGPLSDPSLATRETLGQVREDEDRRSWIALGRVPDRHELLRYPDGGVADVPFDELVDRIAAILRDERPDVFITSEGVAAHADHITVGRATISDHRPYERGRRSDPPRQRAHPDDSLGLTLYGNVPGRFTSRSDSFSQLPGPVQHAPGPPELLEHQALGDGGREPPGPSPAPTAFA